MSDSDLWPSLLSRVAAGGSLSVEEAENAARSIMREEATPAQVAGFLMALRTKGETADELEGFARAMLAMAHRVESDEPVVDTCGTGGDRAGTFNISTIAAIVVAACGVRVAKHGNRAASSRCGSADVLEGLGVRIDLDRAGVARCLEDVGIGFMFAPVFHPATAYAAGIRRELHVPTLFNFLGPLTNPARPVAQVVGVSDPRMLPLVAQVLARRGAHAMVFRGEDGLDELTTTALSTVQETRDGQVRERMLDASDLGLAKATAEDLRGGDLETNVAIARSILRGQTGPRRDVVLLNAAAALDVAGAVGSLEEGIARAGEAIDRGSALGLLDRWVAASQAAAPNAG
ncbi:MAG TPA: anthranilate phosphoribosyltransferase [Actinomycetota bacterium]